MWEFGIDPCSIAIGVTRRPDELWMIFIGPFYLIKHDAP